MIRAISVVSLKSSRIVPLLKVGITPKNFHIPITPTRGLHLPIQTAKIKLAHDRNRIISTFTLPNLQRRTFGVDEGKEKGNRKPDLSVLKSTRFKELRTALLDVAEYEDMKKRAYSLLMIIAGIHVGLYLLWDYVSKDKREGLSFMTRNFTLSRTNLQEGRIWTLLTSGFTHSSLLHALMHSGLLLTVGYEILMFSGPKVFLSIYLSGLLCGAIAELGYEHYIHQDLAGPPPEWNSFISSGSVSALAIIYQRLWPYRVPVSISGYFKHRPHDYIYIYLLFQSYGLYRDYQLKSTAVTTTPGGTSVGYVSTVGGIICGLLVHLFYYKTKY